MVHFFLIVYSWVWKWMSCFYLFINSYFRLFINVLTYLFVCLFVYLFIYSSISIKFSLQFIYLFSWREVNIDCLIYLIPFFFLVFSDKRKRSPATSNLIHPNSSATNDTQLIPLAEFPSLVQFVLPLPISLLRQKLPIAAHVIYLHLRIFVWWNEVWFIIDHISNIFVITTVVTYTHLLLLFCHWYSFLGICIFLY